MSTNIGGGTNGTIGINFYDSARKLFGHCYTTSQNSFLAEPSQVYEAGFGIPGNAKQGIYKLDFYVTPYFCGAFGLQFLWSNIVTKEIVVGPPPPPDLSVDESISFWGATYGPDGIPSTSPGEKVVASFYVRGKGFDYSDTRNALITLKYGSHSISKTVSLSRIFYSASLESIDFTFSPDDVGDQIVTVTINADNALPETNKSNNSVSRLIRLGGLSLQAQMLDANEKQIGSPVKKSVKNGDSISIPLGGFASLSLLDGGGNEIPASFKLSGNPVFDTARVPVDTKNGLYLDRLAILFGDGAPDLSQELMPVHLGVQTLVISPQDSAKYPPISIQLNAIRPTQVGTGIHDCTHTQADGTIVDTIYANCDDLVIDQAHAKGLPPQFIKSEMWQESYKHSFKKDSFRYEPSYDRTYVSQPDDSLQNVQEPESLAYYNSRFFRKGSMNPAITTQQVHLRSQYWAKLSNGTFGYIPDNFEKSFKGLNYYPLTSWNMIDTDLNHQKNANGAGDPQGWFRGVSWPKDGKRFNFVAQTLVASSYGIMQIMYPTAVEEMNYQEGGVGREPLELFRPKINVDLGVGYLAIKYKELNKNSILTGAFSNVGAYLGSLMPAAAAYNAGKKYKKFKPQMYSISVDQQMKKYWIVQQPNIGN